MLILASISGIQDFLLDVRESGGGHGYTQLHDGLCGVCGLDSPAADEWRLPDPR